MTFKVYIATTVESHFMASVRTQGLKPLLCFQSRSPEDEHAGTQG